MFFDENYLEPEVQDFIDFMQQDERDSSGILTKAKITDH